MTAPRSPTPVLVRAFAAADIAAVTDIYADAVINGTATYELDPPNATEMARRFAGLAEAGYPVLVADLNGHVVGYAYAGPYRTRPAYRFMVEDSIYVAPGVQGRGIGDALLAGLLVECERRGYRQIVAVIGDGSNHRASLRIHEKHGFRHVGLLEATGFKHGRWLDTALMQRPLNGGSATLPGDGPDDDA